MSKNNAKVAAAPAAHGAAPVGRTTKIDILIGLMRRPEGADVATLAAATSWQVHSVRGAIAGHIKKKLGLAVTTAKTEGKTVYRMDS
jgi:hypothetical protein